MRFIISVKRPAAQRATLRRGAPCTAYRSPNSHFLEEFQGQKGKPLFQREGSWRFSDQIPSVRESGMQSPVRREGRSRRNKIKSTGEIVRPVARAGRECIALFLTALVSLFFKNFCGAACLKWIQGPFTVEHQRNDSRLIFSRMIRIYRPKIGDTVAKNWSTAGWSPQIRTESPREGARSFCLSTEKSLQASLNPAKA